MSSDAPPAASDFLLLILSSPSGAGKTTLKNRLLSAHPELRFSVSHTTRRPRPTERDGREYWFVDRAKFEAMIEAGRFAEWAEVHGNLYGTSLAEIEAARASHRGVVFDIDHQGARQIKAKLPGAVGVFILPPSMAELERRLRARGTEEEDAVRRRLSAARLEIEHYGFFDYLIVNDDVAEAAARLDAIVLAERSRRGANAARAEQLLAAGQVRGQ
jgi:guanylate kinase